MSERSLNYFIIYYYLSGKETSRFNLRTSNYIRYKLSPYYIWLSLLSSGKWNGGGSLSPER